jgi:hypothetical protein
MHILFNFTETMNTSSFYSKRPSRAVKVPIRFQDVSPELQPSRRSRSLIVSPKDVTIQADVTAKSSHKKQNSASSKDVATPADETTSPVFTENGVATPADETTSQVFTENGVATPADETTSPVFTENGVATPAGVNVLHSHSLEVMV